MNLHEYQHRGADLAKKHRRWIFNDEMGLGKSPQAITTVKELGCQKIAIVCPAVVRHNWLNELKKWWSEHPEAVAHRWGKGSKSVPKYAQDWWGKPIQIVSYGMVDSLDLTGWDAIIIDEIHKCKNPKSKQSKAVRKLVSQNRSAVLLGLTGTIMPNQPMDCWNPVDIIKPGHLGYSSNPEKVPWKFLERYCTKIPNEYSIQGYTYGGINELFAEELGNKLSAISSRTTKAEVAHLMPAYTVNSLFIQPAAKSEYVKLSASVITQEDVEKALRVSGSEKVESVVEWVGDASENASHVCVMTYFRSTARAITEALRKKGHNVFEVSGALDPHKRNEEIKKAIAAESAVLVATMKSTGIGIDLTRFTQAIFAELYYSPEVMEQALGRFSRMSGTLPSNVMLLVMEQTLDERIASRLHDKLEAINLAIKAGATSEQLCSSLGSQENYLNNILAKVDVVTHDEYDF